MKQYRYFTAGAMFALLLAGCTDDDLVKKSVVLPVSGNEVEFGAAPGGFTDVDPTTRTVYDVPSGSTFDTYTLLNIKWQYDIDQVRVYCPEGEDGFKTADYTVTEAADASSGTSTGFLVKNGETGVRWGDTNTDHHFYAFYSLDRIDNGLQSGTTVTATIPTGQEGGQLLTYNNQGEEDANGKFKIITPDMSFCLMAGEGTWTSGSDKNVALTFTPIATVLDVLVNGPSSEQAGGIDVMKIVSVSVRSKTGKNIVGTFSYDLATKTYDFSATDGSQTATSIATVQTIDPNTTNPVEIKTGEQLNVKFFLLPREVPNGDLVVSVFTEGGVVYNKTVSRTNGTDDILSAGLITRIKTPKLGGQDANNWMSLIPNNALFTQLSLPGSKNSFAYTVDANYDPQTGISNFYQALPPLGINASAENSTQFDEGVRVFDVHLNLTRDSRYATPIVYAGGANVDPQITLEEVLTALNKKIHPESKPVTECAVVFLNFVKGESLGGTSNVSTWLSAVMNALNDWDQRNSGVLTTFDANTTMLDMRGKIAVIFNLENSDNLPSGTAPINYIIGLSTSVQNTSIVDATFSSGADVRIQNLQQCNNPNITSTGDYGYRGDGIGLVPYFITKANYVDPSVSCNLIETKTTLMKQINSEIASSAGKLYINDLSGFCVTMNERSTGYETFEYREWRSIWGVHDWRPLYDWDNGKYYDYQKVRALPTDEYRGAQDGDRYLRNYNNVGTSYSDLGNGGNTCLFAQIFNEKAVNAYSSLVGNLRQPLGIVLMNFAGVGTVETNSGDYQVQGIRLPGLIMMNNFMFPLKTRTTNTKTSSDTSYSKAGNVWD